MVICISTEEKNVNTFIMLNGEPVMPGKFTLYKKYEYVSNADEYYLLYDDTGRLDWFHQSLFKPIDLYRDDVISKIIE